MMALVAESVSPLRETCLDKYEKTNFKEGREVNSSLQNTWCIDFIEYHDCFHFCFLILSQCKPGRY